MNKDTLYSDAFFGIPSAMWNSEINIDNSIKMRLAMLLFLSSSTSVKEAKKMVGSKKFLERSELLLNILEKEVKDTCKQNNADKTTDDNIEEGSINTSVLIAETIEKKFPEWVSTFGPPMESEIAELCTSYCISHQDMVMKSYLAALFSILNTPSEIASLIARTVVGQERAVADFAQTIFFHRERCNGNNFYEKINTLFIGETGCGKTLLFKTANQFLDIPSHRTAVAEMVSEGIVGKTKSEILTHLFISSNGSLRKMKKGLIMLDEIDKPTRNRFYGESIYSQLLGLFDDTLVDFPESFERFPKMNKINTESLCICAAGAFQDIDGIVAARILTENKGNSKYLDMENIRKYINHTDLINYGLPPELVARFNRISFFNSLDSNRIYDILTRSNKSDVLIHTRALKAKDIELQFTDKALYAIADYVSSKKLGARYIKNLMNTLLNPYYYNPGNFKGHQIIVDTHEVQFSIMQLEQQHILDIFETAENPDLLSISEHLQMNLDDLLDMYIAWKSYIKKTRR